VAALARPAGGHHVALDDRAHLDPEGQVVEGRVAVADHLHDRRRPAHLLGAAVVDAGLVDEEVVGHQLLGHRQVAVPQLQHPAALQPPEVVVLSGHAPIVPGRPRR
jgi:hypothetical protein